MVICGGVNSLVSPDLFIPLSRARMISPTGQCQAFSAKADGYCRGEGCGIVILKKLGEVSRDLTCSILLSRKYQGIDILL